MVGGSFGWKASDNDEEDVLIQFWKVNSSNTNEYGRKYWELTTQEYKPFHIVYGYNEALWSHRMQSIGRTITIHDDDELENDPQQIFITRVFRNKVSDEWNTLKNKYPDFVINCGIRSCLYIPVYKTAGDYYSGGSPCGVMEYVSTCEEYLEKFRLYLGLTFWRQKKRMYMYGNHLYGFGRLNILEHAVLEMDQLLTVLCQKFPLPLAQYWVTPHPHTEPFRVMYQQSHTEMKNLNILDKFKQACMEMRFNRDEGLVGTAYASRKTFFCNNIKELSITNQHLAQYASYNMSIPCFVICLKGIFPESRDCVLEFFLPPQEMISTYNHQNLLNSLLATMKDHLPSFMIASGERLGQVLTVEVINSSIHNEPRFLKLGECNSSLPHHEYEGLPSHELSHLWKSLFEEDEHIVGKCSTNNSCNETATVKQDAPGMAPAMTEAANTLRISPPGAAAQQPPPAAAVADEAVRILPPQPPQHIPNPPASHIATFYQSPHLQSDNVRDYWEYSQLLQSTGDDIQLHQHANSLMNPLPHTQTSVDDSRAESSIKCIQPQSLTFKSKRSKENLINEGNTEEIDHSALETTLEVAIKHKEHIVAADTVDELVEEPPIVDIGHNMDVRYTMNTASQISNFKPTISFPQQVEEETMVLDTLAQNSRNILVTENDDTTIPVVNKTCQEVHTSKKEIKPPEDISFESLREHFGRPLDDAAASFTVSRSTFKRICRVHGIKRWPNGKRTMSDNISSNLKRKLNDEEPSRRNFSRSGMPSSQDTVVAHTSQDLNKMTVKATYGGITIRFELPDLSGIAELEDNVIERLHLERTSFSIKYQDDEGDWILIACDKDVQECMKISKSSKKSTIKMLIDPPINNHHAH